MKWPFLVLLALIPYGLYAQLQINEIVPGYSTYLDDAYDNDDWIELHNSGPSAIDLSSFYLSDKLGALDKYSFPAGLIIPANEYVLVWADKDEEQGDMHARFKLDAKGETVYLSQLIDNNISLLDSIVFGEIPPQCSYAKKSDGSGIWEIHSIPSPMEDNAFGRPYMSPVQFSLESGLYEGGAYTLELTHEHPSAQIYYTTDATEPDTNSLLYEEPIDINSVHVIMARAYVGNAASTVEIRAYMEDTDTNLPVLHVVTEEGNLRDDWYGIYVVGDNGVPFAELAPGNYFQDWERPAYLALIEADGTTGFTANCGISIAGNFSRSSPQKSLNISFAQDYGQSKLEYKIFPDKPYEKYDDIKLRNTGNYWRKMLFKDAINQTLVEGLIDLDQQSYRPVIVYLNGEYWGIQNFRDRINRDYVKRLFPEVNRDEVDIIDNPGQPFGHMVQELKAGDTEAYDELVEFAQENELWNDALVDYFSDQVDVNELINYFIVETYINNHDWPGNNVKIWREKPDGKWRWVLFDTDLSTRYDWFDTVNRATCDTCTAWQEYMDCTLMFRKLFDHSSLRHEFMQRSCTFSNVIFERNRVKDHIGDMIEHLGINIDRHRERWELDEPYSQFFEEIDLIEDFYEGRAGNYRLEIQYIEGVEQFVLTVALAENEGGHLVFHENEMVMPYDFSGNYLTEVPLRIRAVAHEGYFFDGWLELEESSPLIHLVSEEDRTLTPIFRPDDEMPTHSSPSNTDFSIRMSPIPVSDRLQLDLAGQSPLGNIQVELFNTAGELLLKEGFRIEEAKFETELDLETAPQGIYLIVVHHPDGIVKRKVIKVD